MMFSNLHTDLYQIQYDAKHIAEQGKATRRDIENATSEANPLKAG